MQLEIHTCPSVCEWLKGPKSVDRSLLSYHEASEAQAWCPSALRRRCGHHALSDETSHWLLLYLISTLTTLTTNHINSYKRDLTINLLIVLALMHRHKGRNCSVYKLFHTISFFTYTYTVYAQDKCIHCCEGHKTVMRPFAKLL